MIKSRVTQTSSPSSSRNCALQRTLHGTCSLMHKGHKNPSRKRKTQQKLMFESILATTASTLKRNILSLNSELTLQADAQLVPCSLLWPREAQWWWTWAKLNSSNSSERPDPKQDHCESRPFKQIHWNTLQIWLQSQCKLQYSNFLRRNVIVNKSTYFDLRSARKHYKNHNEVVVKPLQDPLPWLSNPKRSIAQELTGRWKAEANEPRFGLSRALQRKKMNVFLWVAGFWERLKQREIWNEKKVGRRWFPLRGCFK